MHKLYCKTITALIIAVGIIIPTHDSFAQRSATEYQVKAVAFYRFIEFSQWPENSFASQTSPIQVCILGGNPFGDGLDFISDRIIAGRPLVLEDIPSIEHIANCHALFINRDEDNTLQSILDQTLPYPVLTVSDIDNFAERGGVIGLTIVGDNIRFQVNRGAALTKGLRLSSSLLEIAERVYGGGL